MARSSKTTASKSRGGIKARGRPAKKTSDARKKTDPFQDRGAPEEDIRKGHCVQIPSQCRRGQSARTDRSKHRDEDRLEAGERISPAEHDEERISRHEDRLEAGERSPQAEHDEERIATKLEAGERISQTEHDEERVNRSAITNPVTEAMALGTEVVSGAILAGGEIVAATADMANSAARTAVAVTTGVVPDGSQESGSKRER